jgi:hypothetical protein
MDYELWIMNYGLFTIDYSLSGVWLILHAEIERLRDWEIKILKEKEIVRLWNRYIARLFDCAIVRLRGCSIARLPDCKIVRLRDSFGRTSIRLNWKYKQSRLRAPSQTKSEICFWWCEECCVVQGYARPCEVAQVHARPWSAGRDMQHASCILHHASYSMQHTACNRQ